MRRDVRACGVTALANQRAFEAMGQDAVASAALAAEDVLDAIEQILRNDRLVAARVNGAL